MPDNRQTDDGRTGDEHTANGGSPIDRRGFLILTGAVTTSGSWFTGSATADQADATSSVYGAGGYGTVPFGGVEETTN